MKAQDKPRLVAMMLKLQSVFPKDLNEHTYDAYFMALKIWRIEKIEKAGLRFIGTETFFPLPKDFNDFLRNDNYSEEAFERATEPRLALPNKVKELIDEATKKPTDLLELPESDE